MVYVIKYRKDKRYDWSTSRSVFTNRVSAKSAIANNPALRSYEKRIVQLKKAPNGSEIIKGRRSFK